MNFRCSDNHNPVSSAGSLCATADYCFRYKLRFKYGSFTGENPPSGFGTGFSSALVPIFGLSSKGRIHGNMLKN
jgi:hypothetical protein